VALEAVRKLKEAEDKGASIIREATAKAEEIKRGCEAACAQKREEILSAAESERESLITSAREKAAEECEALSFRSESEISSVLDPGDDKLESAVSYICGKIVGV